MSFNRMSGLFTLSDRLLGVLVGASTHAVAGGVADLARRFTTGRAEPRTMYLGEPALAAAYEAYYLPVNAAKVQMLLDELPDDWVSTAAAGRLDVLDVGGGPGTGALAVLDWIEHRAPHVGLRVTAVDHEPAAVEACERLWRRYLGDRGGLERTLFTSRVDLERDLPVFVAQAPRFDLIIVANVLDELARGARDPIARRTELIELLLGLLARSGTMMIIEPALRDTARGLHAVRDLLLERGACGVYSPCLHERPCPALVKETDWCHEERAWQPAPQIQEIDQEVGFIKDAVKFSYLLLRTDGRTVVPRAPDLYRVVSELREMKGESRAWLCHEGGRPEVGRLDRQRSPANAAFGAVQRGTIVKISEIQRGQRKGREATLGRIRPETAVEIVRKT